MKFFYAFLIFFLFSVTLLALLAERRDLLRPIVVSGGGHARAQKRSLGMRSKGAGTFDQRKYNNRHLGKRGGIRGPDAGVREGALAAKDGREMREDYKASIAEMRMRRVAERKGDLLKLHDDNANEKNKRDADGRDRMFGRVGHPEGKLNHNSKNGQPWYVRHGDKQDPNRMTEAEIEAARLQEKGRRKAARVARAEAEAEVAASEAVAVESRGDHLVEGEGDSIQEHVINAVSSASLAEKILHKDKEREAVASRRRRVSSQRKRSSPGFNDRRFTANHVRGRRVKDIHKI